MIAVMGPEAAVNAVFTKKIAEQPEDERDAYVARKRAEYAEDVDILKLASELIVDAIVPANDLRQDLIRRFGFYREGYTVPSQRKHGVTRFNHEWWIWTRWWTGGTACSI